MKRKFLSLAGVGILGFALPLTAKAAQIKVSDETFEDFQAQARVFYLNADKGGYSNPEKMWTNYRDYRSQQFFIYKFRLGVKGQINKLVSFYGNFDSNDNEGYQTMLWEGAVQFNFRPEFILEAGKIRTPFSRHNFIGRHNSPVMSSDGDYFLADQFKTALKPGNPYEGGYRGSQAYKRTDMGMMIKGSIKEGLIKYFAGIFQEDKSNSNKVWTLSGKWDNAVLLPGTYQKTWKNFEYDARIEFTPTFWGFKQEPNVFDPSSREYQTYGGNFDFMTIGFGYHQEKHLENLDESKYGASSLTRRAYDADFAFEKMFYKKYLIGAELGYMYFKDTHLYQDLNTYKKGDMWTWYGEAHLIYAEKVGIGFPGIGFRYEYVETDGKFEDSKTGEIFKDLSYDRYGVCLSYYLRKTKRGIDVTNRFGIGFDYVKARDALKEYIKRKDQDDSNFTWYAAVYFNF